MAPKSRGDEAPVPRLRLFAGTFSRLSTDQTIRMMEKGIVKGSDTVSAAEGWLQAP